MPALHASGGNFKRKAVDGGFLYRGAQWDTHQLQPDELVTGPRNEDEKAGGSPGYYQEGFLFLQNLVDEKIAKKIFIDGFTKAGGPDSKEEAEKSFSTLLDGIILQLRRYAFPTFKDHFTVTIIHEILPIVIVFAYLVPVMLMVSGTVSEKESGIRVNTHDQHFLRILVL
jgi:ATP-binding cassette subfamily A (ABC1) protein 3